MMVEISDQILPCFWLGVFDLIKTSTEVLIKGKVVKKRKPKIVIIIKLLEKPRPAKKRPEAKKEIDKINN